MTIEPESSWRNSLRTAIGTGKQAAWQNRYAGLCLWLFGCGIVLGYYNVPLIRDSFEALGELKLRSGWVFGIVSTALFGGLLPELLSLCSVRVRTKGLAGQLFSNVLFWGYKGFEVDLLYRFQAWMFGDGTDVATIASKVFLDIGIYAPLAGLLNCVLFYIWRDNGYSFAATRESLGENWYVRKVMPALISNWCVWLPAVVFIYTLPLALQLPVQNLILCFWVMVLVFFTTESVAEDKARTEARTEV